MTISMYADTHMLARILKSNGFGCTFGGTMSLMNQKKNPYPKYRQRKREMQSTNQPKEMKTHTHSFIQSNTWQPTKRRKNKNEFGFKFHEFFSIDYFSSNGLHISETWVDKLS